MLSLLLYVGLAHAIQETSLSACCGQIRTSIDNVEKKCLVHVKNKKAAEFACQSHLSPIILEHLNKPVDQYDDVVVVQEVEKSDSCNGGPLHVIGIRKDGTFTAFPPIAFCGGRGPEIKLTGKGLAILLPGSVPNPGQPAKPDEFWELQGGQLRLKSKSIAPN